MPTNIMWENNATLEISATFWIEEAAGMVLIRKEEIQNNRIEIKF